LRKLVFETAHDHFRIEAVWDRKNKVLFFDSATSPNAFWVSNVRPGLLWGRARWRNSQWQGARSLLGTLRASSSRPSPQIHASWTELRLQV